MRFITSFFFILLSGYFLSCKSKRKELPLILNITVLDSLFLKFGNNIAILSCLRCECFEKYFNEVNNKPEKFILFADSNCNKLPQPFVNISNLEIEKISDGLYNLTLIKKEGSKIKTKILDAGNNNSIKKNIITFF